MSKIKKIIFLIMSIFSLQIVLSHALEIDEKAPDFTLKDSYGRTVKLSDYSGKTVVLEWVNYDCPFVKKHYDSKNMQNLQKKYTEKEIVWLSICSSAPDKQGNFNAKEIHTRMQESKASPSAYLVDEEGKVGKMYGAKTTPHMFIINQKGTLVYQGGIDSIKSFRASDVPKAENYVARALEEILENRAVSKSSSQPYGCSVKY